MLKQKIKRDMVEKLKSLSGSRKASGLFGPSKSKPTSVPPTETTKLFGITENCTPGEPMASLPDQYDELKR